MPAVAGLIGLTVVATVAAIVIDSARRREELVRKEAEANFIMAQTAVDDYFTDVSENKLLKEQDVLDNRRLRGTLLRKSQQYYQKFVNQRADDPTLRRQLANAYFRVGAITQEIGSPEQAIAVVSVGPRHLGKTGRQCSQRRGAAGPIG